MTAPSGVVRQVTKASSIAPKKPNRHAQYTHEWIYIGSPISPTALGALSASRVLPASGHIATRKCNV